MPPNLNKSPTQDPGPFLLGLLPVIPAPPPASTPRQESLESRSPWVAAAAGIVLAITGGGGGLVDIAATGSLFGFVTAWFVIRAKTKR